MKQITRIEPEPLAIGIQKILLDIYKKHGKAAYPIYEFERLIMESKQVSNTEAKYVTLAVLNTGIIQKDNHNCFIL